MQPKLPGVDILRDGRSPLSYIHGQSFPDSTLVWIGGSIVCSRRTWKEYDTSASQSSTGNAAIFHLVEKSNCPGRSRQYPLRPWRVPFSQGFSRTELATTNSAKVTRDNELTCQEEFSSSRSRPGPSTEVCGSHYPNSEENRGGCTGPVTHPVEQESDC